MKKGDFMYWKTFSGEWVSIFDHIDEYGRVQCIFSIGLPEKKFYTKPEEYQKCEFYPLCNISSVRECRAASLKEKNILLNILEENGFSYNELTMKLVPKIEFRHGDFVQVTDIFGDEWLIIFDKKDDSTGAMHFMVAWNTNTGYFSDCIEIQSNVNIFCQNPKSGLRSCRLGTSEEWDMLNAELKKRNLQWDAENGLLNSILEPFEKVLVRDTKENMWRGDMFTRYQSESSFPFWTLGDRRYRYCISYKGNEHLLGTTNPAY